MTRLIKFRCYADTRRSFWAEARVFKTRAAMCLDIRACTGVAVDPQTAGQVSGTKMRKRGKALGIFAVLWLNEPDIVKNPTEIATHESVHAAIRYFERRGWPVCLHQETIHGAVDVHERRLEERLAYAAGRIAKHITRGLFRHGVWKRS